MPTKNRQQLLVFVAIGAVALFVGNKVLLEPLLGAWKARGAQVAALRNQISRGRMLLQRDRAIRNHWSDMQHRALTNNTSAAEQQVFRAVDAWAQDTGVSINAITPQWKRDTDDYATYECRIDATADLQRLTRFLYRVEREPLALKIDAIELGARDKEGQLLSLSLQLSGLVLNPPTR